jgi:hypothetical protein
MDDAIKVVELVITTGMVFVTFLAFIFQMITHMNKKK